MMNNTKLINTYTIGGAYLPLDVSYPSSLMESVLKDSEPVAVVSSSDLADRIEGYKSSIFAKK